MHFCHIFTPPYQHIPLKEQHSLLQETCTIDSLDFYFIFTITINDDLLKSSRESIPEYKVKEKASQEQDQKNPSQSKSHGMVLHHRKNVKKTQKCQFIFQVFPLWLLPIIFITSTEKYYKSI